MRSSKSRSRNKSRNNQRSLGNVVNRVFDSSGPEGKVRGTPQQIIEKYLALARDAQLSGDRVAEQSFLQHAEHYTRMLGEAAREQAERQAQFGGAQQPGSDDREERPAGQDRRDDGREPQRRDADSDSSRRDDGRRDDGRRDDRRRDDARRDDARRDETRRDETRRDDRRDRPARDAQAQQAVAGPDSLPDFLRPPGQGIPEAVAADSDAGLVDTRERDTADTADRGPIVAGRDEAAGERAPLREPAPADAGVDDGGQADRAGALPDRADGGADGGADAGQADSDAPADTVADDSAPDGDAGDATVRRPRRRAAAAAPRRTVRKRGAEGDADPAPNGD